jgi:hypothetical protein
MSAQFVVYLLGFIVVIAGLAWGARLAGLADTWIGVGIVVLIGFGILSAVTKTQRKAPPS